MSIAGIRMLRWMSVVTRKYRISIQCVQRSLGVTLIDN